MTAEENAGGPGAPLTARDELDPGWAWARYEPSPRTPWGPMLAAHLLRRAGFGPTWDELQRSLARGPQATIDELLQAPASYADEVERSGDLWDAAVRGMVLPVDGHNVVGLHFEGFLRQGRSPVNDDLLSRINNGKYESALAYLDGEDEHTRDLIVLLARLVGNNEPWGDLGTLIWYAVEAIGWKERGD